MNHTLEEIDRCFSAEERTPLKNELVKFDGFDELDKQSAVDNFGGKSSDAVFECVRKGKWGWRSTHLEDWTVLQPEALRYYLRPYLKSLVLELDEPHPDVDFIANLFFELEQAVKMKGPKLFEDSQRKLLLDIGLHVLEAVQNDDEGRFEIGGEHIAKNIRNASKALGNQVSG